MDQDITAASSGIPWHPAFVQAIQLELEQYQDVLEFRSEYRLTAEPLEIDVVIVKKAPEAIIEKNIARIFKRVNLLEYKSPDDYFSVYDFYKVLGYAYLYAALNQTLIEDMTISIIETRYPRELFKYLGESANCRISEGSPGIYSISGYPVSIQVIECKKLSLSENLWLKGLNNDLNAADAGAILKESRKKDRGAQIGAYLYALLSANSETIEEVLEMAEGQITLEEALEKAGLTAKWEKRGEAKGISIGEAKGISIGEAKGEKNAWEKAIKLLRQGYTVEQLERMKPGAPAE
jgi:hypothetical protein